MDLYSGLTIKNYNKLNKMKINSKTNKTIIIMDKYKNLINKQLHASSMVMDYKLISDKIKAI